VFLYQLNPYDPPDAIVLYIYGGVFLCTTITLGLLYGFLAGTATTAILARVPGPLSTPKAVTALSYVTAIIAGTLALSKMIGVPIHGAYAFRPSP